MSYEEFIAHKKIVVKPSGLQTIPNLNQHLKPFQEAIARWTLRQRNAAIFAATGLGKTLMELVYAQTVANHEQGSVLLLSPLAVAEQTVQEAIKFGIPGVSYARDSASINSPIVVTNYERFCNFDIESFVAIVLDESSIIKSADGITRQTLIDACSSVRWKLCATATPAPNDYVELGSHSEFLDIMTHREMLATFFVKDDEARLEGNPEYRLKRHAIKPFWQWLASWSVMIRRPEDLGYDAPEYALPPLIYKRLRVDSNVAPPSGAFFPDAAKSLRDRMRARRLTLKERVAKVVEIVNAEPNQQWLIWCNLNDEADALEKAITSALQVSGSQPIELKVERLLGFKDGRPPILVSKPALAGHGLNWQHCHRIIFAGLTDSFELTYQAIRRVWRFGQTEPVHCYFVHADIEGNVIENLKRKERDFDNMLNEMSIHMIDTMRENVRGAARRDATYDPQCNMEIPAWLRC